MNNDPENNEQLKQALKSYGLKQEIGRLHKEIIPSLAPKAQAAPVISMARYITKIAATLLLLVTAAALYVYFSSTANSLFNNIYTPYETSAQRSGQQPNASAMDFFTDGQHYLQINEPLKAIGSFQQLLNEDRETGRVTLKDDAEFYLALAYLKAGRVNDAYPIFEKIHNDTAHLYHSEVNNWFLFRMKVLAWKNK